MNRLERWRAVAELHAASIDRGFLSSLGVPFLTQLYRAIDESPESVLLVRELDGKVAGFVAGSIGMAPVRRALLRRPWSLLAALAPALVRPRMLVGLLEVVRATARASGRKDLPQAELLSLAVDPDHRRQGLAESLYRELLGAFAAMGARRFRIVVGDSLLPAQRFYSRMGAGPVAHAEIHRGQRSTILVHDLQGPDPRSKHTTEEAP